MNTTTFYLVAGAVLLVAGFALGYGIATIRYKGRFDDDEVYRQSKPRL